MNTIAQTITRPAHDGRLVIEVQVEGGALHVFEVDGDKFYRALKPILSDAATRRIASDRPEEPPISVFDPTQEVNAS